MRFHKHPVVLALTVVLAAGGPGLSEPNGSTVPATPDDRTIVHVLNRLTFGPTPGDIDRVRAMGLQAYIDQQLRPERLDDKALAARLSTFETLSQSSRELAERYFLPAQMARRQRQRAQAADDPSMAPNADAVKRDALTPEQADAMRMERNAISELMQAKLLRAAYSERQLEEVMVDFWFNHFNVFAGKGAVRLYVNEYERDAIRPHVLGKFHDLLKATAESPAMLFYLDNWQSSAPEGAPVAGVNDDARRRRTAGMRTRAGRGQRDQVRRPETLADLPAGAQNRRRGLNENYARELMELHTLGVDGGYTQRDVQEVARAFTGWTIATPRQGGSFRFEPRLHDDGEKTVMGHRIKAGGGRKDGDDVLALLAAHPSTARFISLKLARRFVADEPPAGLVDRAARRFRETGGDIREVVRAIVTSPEFFAPASYRAKVRTPLEFVVGAVRATGIDLPTALPLVQAVRTLGMPVYGCQPPTGYADKAEAWVNSGALLNRMNFAVTLASGRQGRAGQRTPGAATTTGTPAIASGDALVKLALAGEVSETTAATIARAATPSQAMALVLGSPEFQRK